jgi:hypothetical protein
LSVARRAAALVFFSLLFAADAFEVWRLFYP